MMETGCGFHRLFPVIWYNSSMRGFLLQHQKKLILFIGCGLIPFILLSTLLWIGFSERNLSGLLTEPSFFPFVHIAFLLMLAWLVFVLSRIAQPVSPLSRRVKEFSLMSVLIAMALFLGWDPDNGMIQTVHIILSYAAFVYMNVLFFRYCYMYEKERKIYLALAFTAFMISVAYGEVSGISEVLYASACSILLSWIASKI